MGFVGGQHRHCGAEPDPVGGRGGGVDQGGRRRQRHRLGAVLTEAEEVQAYLLGHVDCFEHVADGLRG